MNKQERSRAARMIRLMRQARSGTDEAAVHLLILGCTDPALSVRRSAARLVSGLPGLRGEALLSLLLGDPHPQVYRRALAALERRGLNLESRLQHALLHGSEADRADAARTLAKLGLPSAAVFLFGSLFTSSAAVTADVTTSLLLLRDPEVLTLLGETAQSAPPERRAAMARGLAALLPEHGQTWLTRLRLCDRTLDAHLAGIPERLAAAGLVPLRRGLAVAHD